jgi:hypothetical protein
MPPINEYRCSKCGFSLQRGWGGYKYVEADAALINERISKLSEVIETLEKINQKITEEERVIENLTRDISDLMRGFEDLGLEGLEWRRGIRDKYDVLHASTLQFVQFNQEVDLLSKQKRELKRIEKRLRMRDQEEIRVECPHPGELDTVMLVLGRNATPDLIKERTGFNSHCVCLDCLHQFDADLRDEIANPWRLFYDAPDKGTFFRGLKKLFAVNEKCIPREVWKEISEDWEKDERKCPQCGSSNVKTVFELIGEPCPKCKEGTIEEIATGIMC